MTVLRCTAKLLKRLKQLTKPIEPEPETKIFPPRLTLAPARCAEEDHAQLADEVFDHFFFGLDASLG